VADDFAEFLPLLKFWRDEDEPESGDHPAFDAASNGDLAALRRFVEAGFDVNAKSKDGWTLLMVSTQRPAVVAWLLANGADIHAVDSDKKEPLLHACTCYETTKLLLEHGANPNCRSKRWKSAPILDAYDLRTLKLLLAHGADLSVRDKGGESVFDVWKKASAGNRRLAFRILIDAGYDVEPEVDRLIKTLSQYTGPGYPGRKLRPAEMKRIANKICDIGNELVETCRTLAALGNRASRATPFLEALLTLVPESDVSMIEETLRAIGRGTEA
jgi:ankyrin repeat protein